MLVIFFGCLPAVATTATTKQREKKPTAAHFSIFFFASGSAVHSEYNANNTFAMAIYFVLRYAHQCAHYIAAPRFFDFVTVVVGWPNWCTRNFFCLFYLNECRERKVYETARGCGLRELFSISFLAVVE